MAQAGNFETTGVSRKAAMLLLAMLSLLTTAALVAAVRARGGDDAPDGSSLPLVESQAARPGGVITYEVTGKGLFTSAGDGSPLGTTTVEHLHAEGHVASPVESATSPDGRWVASVQRRADGTFLVLAGGGITREIAQLAAGDDPQLVAGGKGHARAVQGVPLVVSWSPDSSMLAFGSVVEPFTLGLLSNPGAAEPVMRFSQVYGGYVGELAWAPDGSKLAVSTYSLDRTQHSVLITDPKSGYVRTLIDGCHITWAPDSSYVAVHRDPGPEAGAWVISAMSPGERWAITREEMAFPLTWREG